MLLCTGDTLGQHLWGGFKEGVGFTFQKCRSCLCKFNEMQQSFDENDFLMRTKHSYERHCLDIANATNEQVKANLRTTYGINIQSPFCALPTFDVTKQLRQDIMHTLLEGVAQYAHPTRRCCSICTPYSKVLLNMHTLLEGVAQYAHTTRRCCSI